MAFAKRDGSTLVLIVERGVGILIAWVNHQEIESFKELSRAK
jgi:hypothetical protein